VEATVRAVLSIGERRRGSIELASPVARAGAFVPLNRWRADWRIARRTIAVTAAKIWNKFFLKIEKRAINFRYALNDRRSGLQRHPRATRDSPPISAATLGGRGRTKEKNAWGVSATS
jgi:hypothetical protein